MGYASLPYKDAVAVPEDPNDAAAQKLPKLRMGNSFVRWLSGLRTEVDARPKRQIHVVLQGQTASLAATPLPIGSITQGVWRISITARVTTPGSVSSALQMGLTWTERGVVQIEQGANLVANLTTTREGKTFIIRTDGASPISYSTTYASVGTPMAYSLDIVAEELAADGQ